MKIIVHLAMLILNSTLIGYVYYSYGTKGWLLLFIGELICILYMAACNYLKNKSSK